MSLSYQSIGEGPPIFMLHGLFCEGRNLLPLGRKLSCDFNAYLIDLRNHGKSIYSKEMNYPVMAKDINDLMEALNLDRIHLLGHSMGGKAAIEFAVRYPEKVSTISILDVAPTRYPPHHNNTFGALLEVDFSSVRSRLEVADVLSKSITDKKLINFFSRNVVIGDGGRLRWRFNLASLYESYGEIQSGVGNVGGVCYAPSLLIKGDMSDYVQEDSVRFTKKLLPNLTMKVIQNTGHWLHAEKPDTVAKLIRNHINDGLNHV